LKRFKKKEADDDLKDVRKDGSQPDCLWSKEEELERKLEKGG